MFEEGILGGKNIWCVQLVNIVKRFVAQPLDTVKVFDHMCSL
jgi:hypothetical protein